MLATYPILYQFHSILSPSSTNHSIFVRAECLKMALHARFIGEPCLVICTKDYLIPRIDFVQVFKTVRASILDPRHASRYVMSAKCGVRGLLSNQVLESLPYGILGFLSAAFASSLAWRSVSCRLLNIFGGFATSSG